MIETASLQSLRTRFAGLAPEQRQALLMLLEREGVDLAREMIVLPRPAGVDRAPLALAQERLWFLSRLEPDTSLYNMPFVLRLAGDLDPEALAWALAEIARRHEILRTTVEAGGERPWQRIHPRLDFAVRQEDLRRLGTVSREATWQRRVREEALAPFDLERGPLLRVLLLRLADAEHVAVVTLHHIIADGWSVSVLVRELAELYQAHREGRAARLAELPFQYADYALWQRAWLTGEVRERLLAFWRQQLAGCPEAISLPCDRPRPAVHAFRGTYRAFAVEASLTRALEGLARRQGTTLFMVLLAALTTLLHRYQGERDLPIGTGLANRRQAGTEALIGFFVNTVVMRGRIAGDPAFDQLLGATRDLAVAAYEHQDLPFSTLVEELQPKRNPSLSSPLVQVVLVHLNFPSQALRLPGLTLTAQPPVSVTTKFDLVLTTFESEEEGLAARLEYNTDLFDDGTIAALVSHFRALLAGIAAAPGTALSRLPLMPAAEREQLLVGWSSTTLDLPGGGATVHQRFAAHAAAAPLAVAVACGEQQLTYGELDTRANRLAHRLRALGAGAESRVGVYLERGCEMVVALLATLKAGAAYVPLDPAYPPGRVAFMAADAGITVLLTQQGLAHELPDFTGERVCLDRPDPRLDLQSASDPEVAVAPQQLAYVIYTSGSSGRPKGVAVAHGALLNYTLAVAGRLGLEPGASFATVSTLAADLGNTMIFPSLVLGGQLRVIRRERLASPEGMAEEMRRVDVLKIVPSHLAALIRAAARPADLLPRRLLVLGGEASPVAFVRELLAAGGGCRIVNHYGPTEATVGITTWELPGDAAVPARPALPLGKPLGNLRVVLLDAGAEPVPVGVAGELYAGGAGLARGYLGHPDLTAASFLPDPFAATPGERLYRTGDRARWLPGGDLEFLGRVDEQLKIHGFRVEPREIESSLREHPAVAQALVKAEERPGREPALRAWVVPDRQRLPGLHLRLRRERLLAGGAGYRLPNGSIIAQQNKNETDYLWTEIFERRMYLRHGVALGDGDVVFDVGANIGMFMLFANAAGRDVRVYSCEPSPRIFALLAANAELHEVAGRRLECAVGAAPGRASFGFYPRFSIMSGLAADREDDKHYVRSFMENRRREGVAQMAPLLAEADRLLDERLGLERVEVEMRTLSELIDELGVTRIDLLKINVEKSEHLVMAGIREEHWPLIRQVVAEVHDVAGRKDALLAQLRRRGFTAVAEQDPLLAGTDLHYLYAVRPRSAAPAATVPAAPEMPAGPPAPAGDGAAQVAYWTTLFDGVYGQARVGGEHDLDTTGWISSYDGRPIPEAEMAEWRDATVARLLQLVAGGRAAAGGRRLLEIGCGTGMLLFAVAPHCREYWATDVSQVVLDTLRRRVEQAVGPAGPLPGVRLLRRAAHDLAGLPAGAFDGVVLNSVVQYFPSLDYLLEVLAAAVERAARGGFVLLGDVRSLPLLEAFHAGVELARAAAGDELPALRRRFLQRLTQEQELLLAPSLFAALRQRLPRVSAVEVRLERGRHHNELTRFRYDVVLRLDGEPAPPAAEWRDWRRTGLSLARLRELLRDEAPERLGLLGVPNRRVAAEVCAAEWLCGAPGGEAGAPTSAAELRQAAAAAAAAAIDPEQLWALGDELPYEVDVCWSRTAAAAGDFDVLLRRRGAAAASDFPLETGPGSAGAGERRWASYGNDPLAARLGRSFVGELRAFLKERLPDYMVPADLVLLDRLPLTPNGKLDAGALPRPVQEEDVAPAPLPPAAGADDRLEQAIAAIWRGVLGIDKVGWDDNFFDIGGHSLLLVDVNSELQEQGLGARELSVVDMFQYPTIRSLARYLRGEEQGAPSTDQATERAAMREQALARRAEEVR
jgi:amino acid adenylation domain-containing protein/FkbM family methyltransferase